MQIISYIDPTVIAFILYYFYMMISIASLATLLIYLPIYLKKEEEEEIKRKRLQFNYLENIYQQIEFAGKSKYYRSSIATLLAKGFAFKSGYPLATYGQISQLLKEGKIDIPEDIKDFIISSAEFYTTFSDSNPDSNIYESIISKILKSLTKLKNEQVEAEQLEKAIEALYKKFN